MGERLRGEGRLRPRRWELDEEDTRWCPECRTYTEHDPEGCVDCGIREHMSAQEAPTAVSGSSPPVTRSSND